MVELVPKPVQGPVDPRIYFKPKHREDFKTIFFRKITTKWKKETK